MKPAEIKDVLRYHNDHEYGAIEEFFLGYPRDLHDVHDDYPLALGNLEINKVVPNLVEREMYTLHYRNLKLYLEMGMKLAKVHGIIRFRQYPWLKHYVEYLSSSYDQD